VAATHCALHACCMRMHRMLLWHRCDHVRFPAAPRGAQAPALSLCVLTLATLATHVLLLMDATATQKAPSTSAAGFSAPTSDGTPPAAGTASAALLAGAASHAYQTEYGYDGESQGGKRHGTGTCVHASGWRYSGAWRHGRQHGQGMMEWPNGATYTGEWVSGKRHGRGTQEYPSGQVYEGSWSHGRKHQSGCTIFASGRISHDIFEHGQRKPPADWHEGARPATATDHLTSNGSGSRAAAPVDRQCARPTTSPAMPCEVPTGVALTRWMGASVLDRKGRPKVSANEVQAQRRLDERERLRSREFHWRQKSFKQGSDLALFDR
jgi:hypothetical protein